MQEIREKGPKAEQMLGTALVNVQAALYWRSTPTVVDEHMVLDVVQHHARRPSFSPVHPRVQ